LVVKEDITDSGRTRQNTNSQYTTVVKCKVPVSVSSDIKEEKMYPTNKHKYAQLQQDQDKPKNCIKLSVNQETKYPKLYCSK
jgi:hypothetical protein